MQRLKLVKQTLRLEAYLRLRPKYCGAEVGDDVHDDVLRSDKMTFQLVDGDDGVVAAMLPRRNGGHYYS
jgi:hypothetical protein